MKNQPLSEISRLAKSVTHVLTEAADRVASFVSDKPAATLKKIDQFLKLPPPRLAEKLNCDCLYTHQFERINLRFTILKPTVQDK